MFHLDFSFSLTEIIAASLAFAMSVATIILLYIFYKVMSFVVKREENKETSKLNELLGYDFIQVIDIETDYTQQQNKLNKDKNEAVTLGTTDGTEYNDEGISEEEPENNNTDNTKNKEQQEGTDEDDEYNENDYVYLNEEQLRNIDIAINMDFPIIEEDKTDERLAWERSVERIDYRLRDEMEEFFMISKGGAMIREMDKHI